MKKRWIPILMMLTFALQAPNLISMEESDVEIARGGGRGGGGGGRGGSAGRSVGGSGRASTARSASQRPRASARGVGNLQRTPSMSRSQAYRASKVVGAAAGAAYYDGYSYADPVYYYPTEPYYYYYPEDYLEEEEDELPSYSY